MYMGPRALGLCDFPNSRGYCVTHEDPRAGCAETAVYSFDSPLLYSLVRAGMMAMQVVDPMGRPGSGLLGAR